MGIAVTGAGGFIGAHLVTTLVAQHATRGIAGLVRTPQKAQELRDRGVRAVVGDLRDPECLAELCRDAEVVFHLAAAVPFGLRRASARELFITNVEGTQRLVQACPASVRRFVYMSTINAVERAPGDPCRLPITEESPCQPQTPYGRSKWLAEQVVRRAAAANAISFLIIRPPSLVYGPGGSPASGMARLIRDVASGHLLTSLDWPGRFSILHVRDLVEATVRLGLSPAFHNETFFLCDEPPVTLSELAEQIARVLGVPRRQRRMPRAVYGVADRLVTALMAIPPVASRIPFQLPMVLHDHAVVSSQKARAVAGFTTRVPLAEGLQETIPWVLPRADRA